MGNLRVRISLSPLMKTKEVKELLIQCICSAHHFLHLCWFDDEEPQKELYAGITLGCKSLRKRIKGAILVLKGERYELSEEVVFSKKEVKKIVKFLQKYLEAT